MLAAVVGLLRWLPALFQNTLSQAVTKCRGKLFRDSGASAASRRIRRRRSVLRSGRGRPRPPRVTSRAAASCEAARDVTRDGRGRRPLVGPWFDESNSR